MLIGTLPAPITSGPLVILIYVVLILLLAGALASVLLRDMVYATGAFAAGMLLVAILYLTIAPFLLFAIQLLIFAAVSAVLLLWMMRETTGLRRTAIGPFGREWVLGAAVSALLLAMVAVVVGATSWSARPAGICCTGFWSALTGPYEVGLATAVILLASAALGAGLILRGTPAVPPSVQSVRSRPGARLPRR